MNQMQGQNLTLRLRALCIITEEVHWTSGQVSYSLKASVSLPAKYNQPHDLF